MVATEFEEIEKYDGVCRPLNASYESRTYLDLEKRQLSSVPKGIQLMLQLRRLDLNHNKLKEIPAWISRLTNLEVLRLDSNELTAIPAEISCLTNLTMLRVDCNKLNGIPDGISCLILLRELAVEGNLISKLPPGVACLSRLERLFVQDGKGAISIKTAPSGISTLPCWKSTVQFGGLSISAALKKLALIEGKEGTSSAKAQQHARRKKDLELAEAAKSAQLEYEQQQEAKRLAQLKYDQQQEADRVAQEEYDRQQEAAARLALQKKKDPEQALLKKETGALPIPTRPTPVAPKTLGTTQATWKKPPAREQEQEQTTQQEFDSFKPSNAARLWGPQVTAATKKAPEPTQPAAAAFRKAVEQPATEYEPETVRPSNARKAWEKQPTSPQSSTAAPKQAWEAKPVSVKKPEPEPEPVRAPVADPEPQGLTSPRRGTSVKDMDHEELMAFLATKNPNARVLAIFRENGVTGAEFVMLTSEDLKEEPFKLATFQARPILEIIKNAQ